MEAALDYLGARGILTDTTKAHGLEIDINPTKEQILARLGEDIQVGRVPLSSYAMALLWIPHLNADGAVTSWTARIFPTPPEGSPKFLRPKGGGGPPYITPSVWALAAKPALGLVLTEGPIKALACIQAGYPTIGLNGVYGATARDNDDKVILHPVLENFNWAKRSVYMAFDADLTTNPDVRRALFRTFVLLDIKQAEVSGISSWDPDEGKGIDDYVAKTNN